MMNYKESSLKLGNTVVWIFGKNIKKINKNGTISEGKKKENRMSKVELKEEKAMDTAFLNFNVFDYKTEWK